MSWLRALCLSAHLLSFALVSFDAAAQVVREDLSIAGTNHAIAVTRFAAAGSAPRAAVLVLHGAGGLDVDAAPYERYASAIAMNGIDAYVVRYFRRGTAATCQCWDTWAQTISDVIAAVSRRPESTRRIGLLGFSLGSAVALAAARDTRVDALVTYGAFLPSDKRAWPDRLPPIVILHGEADESVPLASARELADWARPRSAQVVFHTYPGEGHRQSSWQEPSAADAFNRALALLRDALNGSPRGQ